MSRRPRGHPPRPPRAVGHSSDTASRRRGGGLRTLSAHTRLPRAALPALHARSQARGREQDTRYRGGGVGADTFSGTGSTGSAGCRAQNSLRKADPGHTAVPPLQPDDGGRRQRACWARPFPAKPPPGRGGGGCCTLPGQWTRASCAAPQTRLGFKVLSLKKNGLTLKAAVWDARRQATRPCDPAGRGRGSLEPHKAVCVAPPGQERSAGPAGPRGSARQCGGTSDSAATAAHTGDGGAWLLPPSGKRTPGLRDSRLGQAAGSRLCRRKLSARVS